MTDEKLQRVEQQKTYPQMSEPQNRNYKVPTNEGTIVEKLQTMEPQPLEQPHMRGTMDDTELHMMGPQRRLGLQTRGLLTRETTHDRVTVNVLMEERTTDDFATDERRQTEEQP